MSISTILTVTAICVIVSAIGGLILYLIGDEEDPEDGQEK
jgi:hypothetical protein